MSNNGAVLVFDSGLGGLSILQGLQKSLPYEEFIYYGDTKNAPYGDKTKAEITALTLAAIEPFIQQGIKAVVVACNTATSATISALRQKYHLPIIGVEPALRQAVQDFPHGEILVMATVATLKLEKFNQLKTQLNTVARIHSLPCPGLVELIEAGDLKNPQIHIYLQKLFQPYSTANAVVLGCTHYPLLKNQIQQFLPTAKIYDSALGTAKELKRQLVKNSLLSTTKTLGKINFYSSADALQIKTFYTRLNRLRQNLPSL